ncbi:radical SAM protein [Thermodesulfobacteriota bacterium]
MRLKQLLEESAVRFYRGAQRILPAGYAPPPLFYVILVPYRCNLHCRFCYQRLIELPLSDTLLEKDRVRDFLGQIPRYAAVTYSGGEPFSHPDFPAVLDATAKSHRTMFTTNGVLLDDSKQERLVDLGADGLGKRGLNVLGISMLESGKGEPFDNVFEEKIRLLESVQKKKRQHSKAFPILSLKVTIRNENVRYLDRFLGLLQQGLCDEIVLQLHTHFLFDYLRPGGGDSFFNELPPRPHGDDILIEDAELLKRQLDLLLSSPERKKGLVSFFPEIGRNEILSYYTQSELRDTYYCALPWLAFVIDPSGRAVQCRNPNAEDLSSQSIRRARNCDNFQAFRRAVMNADLAETCTGCCFLRKRIFQKVGSAIRQQMIALFFKIESVRRDPEENLLTFDVVG